jgi:ParB-like chromosome segregation protein Spo0J
MVQPAWPEDTIRSLQLSEFDERFRRYRLAPPEAEREIVDSLKRYGQIAPVVVCLCDGEFLLIDGFKRLTAARSIKGFETLRARAIGCDERSAKAAMYNLNRVGRGVQEIEEAWIVHSLVREDGLSQVEAAELLSHHKSWVCRRLALLERLCPAARQDLSLGLLSPTQARHLVRLPVGNQVEALDVARRDSLSSQEFQGVINLLLASGTPAKKAFVLEKPRLALQQATGETMPGWDPRLSPRGNRIQKQLGQLLEQLSRMENWLSHRGRSELSACDAVLLRSSLEKVIHQSELVKILTTDLLQECFPSFNPGTQNEDKTQ